MVVVSLKGSASIIGWGSSIFSVNPNGTMMVIISPLPNLLLTIKGFSFLALRRTLQFEISTSGKTKGNKERDDQRI